MQRPLITPNHLHEKLVQPETETPNDVQPLLQSQLQSQSQENRNDHNASVIEIENDSSCASKNQSDSSKADNKSSKYLKKDIKTSKRLEKKRLKQQLKLEKKSKKNKNNEKTNKNKNNNDNDNDNGNRKKETTTNDNNRLQSNLKKRSSPFNQEPTVPSVKTKSSVNVKFAFDTIDNSNETNNPEPVDQLTHSTCTDIVVIEHSNANNNGFVQITNNSNNVNNGEYDTLPFIKVEKSIDDTNGMVDVNVDAIGTIRDGRDGNGNILIPLPISCSSSDSIPCMDDSPNFRRATSVPIETHTNLHDSRFITLQPRNIGAQSVIYARKLEKPLPITINIPPKRDQFDKSAQILYQSLKESIDHHFERSSLITSKLCQVCHEFLLVPEAVKCLTCGLVCHHSCTISQVCVNLC